MEQTAQTAAPLAADSFYTYATRYFEHVLGYSPRHAADAAWALAQRHGRNPVARIDWPAACYAEVERRRAAERISWTTCQRD